MEATIHSLGIDRLDAADRIRLVEEIWDTIIEDPKLVEIPEWHIKLIEERLAEHEAHPEAAIPWEEAKARIRQSLTRKRG